MGYGGMSSLNCDNCRVRRIKCDKLEAGCSQCRRVGKTCPGYRDPLSLMFRDESSKVIRKAQARATKPRPKTTTLSSKTTPSASTPPSFSPVDGTGKAASATEVLVEAEEKLDTAAEPSAKARERSAAGPSAATGTSMVSLEQGYRVASFREVHRTPDELGKEFYIQNYLLRHPGEPKSTTELAKVEWVNQDAMQHIIVGIGLAGLNNLTNNQDFRRTALEKRGLTLELLRRCLQAPGSLRQDLSIRNIILLAQFELVFGAPLSVAAANSHVTGCAAILRDQIAVNPLAPLGLMDLLYCMFIPCHEMSTPIPEEVIQILGQCRVLATRGGMPLLGDLTDLASLIACFLDLSTSERRRVREDGSAETTAVAQSLVDLEASLTAWEARLGPWWAVSARRSSSPPDAVFRGRIHTYTNMLVARTWNHYRWTRILVNQMLLDFAVRYPRSTEALALAAAREQRMAAVRRLAEDILTSTPCHYRHPRLADEDLGAMETGVQKHGAGSAGLTVLLFHLKVAGSVSIELCDWAYEMARTIWGTMGTRIASSIMSEMESGRDRLMKSTLG